MAPAFHFMAVALLALNIFAHPGHNVEEEAAERRAFIRSNPNTVRSCASDLARRGHTAAALKRRQNLALKVKAKRSLPLNRSLLSRDLAQYNVSHEVSGMTFGEDVQTLFADNSSCTLQAEVTQGPYYVVGELIREDIREDQAGVPVYLDVQFIDTSTCQPAPAIFVDFWHCNATGVYSGVIANGNGNSNDSTNLDATFLRGIQLTDADGVVQVETIVPGHYDGRTNHIHILAHASGSTVARSNATIGINGSSSALTNFTTRASHVGQLFFDQSLLSRVEEIEPYSSNTQKVTTNAEDSILSSEASQTDPFVQYAQLTDDLADGIMAWISVGIDLSQDQSISAASAHYRTGGVANSQGGMGGGMGGGPAPSGGALPSGSGMPSGGPGPSGSMTAALPSTTASA